MKTQPSFTEDFPMDVSIGGVEPPPALLPADVPSNGVEPVPALLAESSPEDDH